MQILIATSNPHKLGEIRSIIKDKAIEFLTLDALPDKIDEPAEDQDTFEGNAVLKARHYAKATGMLCLADDSGLEVDALGGEPGVRSARYSNTDGPRADRDAANSLALLKNLADTPIEKRTARFVCAMALVDGRAQSGPDAAPRFHAELGNDPASPPKAPHGNAGLNTNPSTAIPDLPLISVVRGTLEGRILTIEEADDPTHPERGRGSNGFGYDPIVFVPDLNKTIAQLIPDEKNAISHRGDAVRKMWPHIYTNFSDGIKYESGEMPKTRELFRDFVRDFMSAAITDHDRARALLQEFPKLRNTPVTLGESVLHYLAIEAYSEAVEFLIREGFEVDSRNEFGDTPLIDVVSIGETQTAEVLLRNGADPNAESDTKDCVLFCAIRSGVPKLVEMLLKHGASVGYVNNTGESAIDIVGEAEENSQEIERVLREAIDAESHK